MEPYERNEVMKDEPKENGIQRLMRVNEEQAAELMCWRWLAGMRLNIQENAVIGGPPWVVVDVDGEVKGQGETPTKAIANAYVLLERIEL